MPLQATINAKDVDVQCDCDGSTFDLSHKLFAARHPEASAGVIRLVAAAMKDWTPQDIALHPFVRGPATWRSRPPVAPP